MEIHPTVKKQFKNQDNQLKASLGNYIKTGLSEMNEASRSKAIKKVKAAAYNENAIHRNRHNKAKLHAVMAEYRK